MDGGGDEGSNSIFKSNAGLRYGFTEPKDPITSDALKVLDPERNWVGRSLWLYWLQIRRRSIDVVDFGRHTSSNFPFPLSLILNGKDVSRSDLGSLRRRNA